jgi:hypothetical protein
VWDLVSRPFGRRMTGERIELPGRVRVVSVRVAAVVTSARRLTTLAQRAQTAASMILLMHLVADHRAWHRARKAPCRSPLHTPAAGAPI